MIFAQHSTAAENHAGCDVLCCAVLLLRTCHVALDHSDPACAFPECTGAQHGAAQQRVDQLRLACSNKQAGEQHSRAQHIGQGKQVVLCWTPTETSFSQEIDQQAACA